MLVKVNKSHMYFMNCVNTLKYVCADLFLDILKGTAVFI